MTIYLKLQSTELFKIKAFQYLIDIEHSKTKELKNYHTELKLANYLKETSLNRKEKKVIFHARTRMLPCKANFKSSYASLICDYCVSLSIDDQQHLLLCSQSQDMQELYNINSVYS